MTYVIIIATALTSYLAFERKDIFNKYKFNAYMVWHKKEWGRIISHGFLHADWGHLIFNMITLYFFGRNVEVYLTYIPLPSWLSAFSDSIEGMFNHYIEGDNIIHTLYFLILYFGAIAFATIPSLKKHKNNHYYNSIGASGGVAAVLFTSIFFDPMGEIGFLILPIRIPGFIFGIAYLGYSYYMSKKGNDNIGHDAHFVGAIFGFTFPIILGVPVSFFLNGFL